MTRQLKAVRTLLAIALVAMGFTPRWTIAQTELHKLVAPDGVEGDWFGWCCSVSGTRGIVGADGDDDFGLQSGAAYIYDVITGQLLWKIPQTGGVANEEFGWSVSMSGNCAVIGAPGSTTNGVYSGAAYIYNVTTGQQRFQVIPRDNQAGDHFGASVATDESLAIIGAPGDQTNGVWSGAAYVVDTTTGVVLRKIVPTDGQANDHLGECVALSHGRAIISAHLNSDSALQAGAVYVFDVTTGQQLHKLYASDAGEEDWFGLRVSIDGNRAIVGAFNNDINGPESGAAYLFDVTTGQELVRVDPADGEAGDYFGSSVAVSGNLAVAGATGDRDLGIGAGSAYIFDSTTGREIAKLHASDGLNHDNYGSCVSASRDRAMIGAIGGHVDNARPGSIFATDLDGPGVEYCFGDDGLGVCPCGNDNDGSVPESGCANGVFPSGGHLAGTGIASVSDDTLVLIATHLEPNNSGLFFQADNDLSPGILWGDGLRCAGGNLKRLQVLFADGNGTASTTLGIHDKAGNVSAGDKKFYQCWYRNTINPPCGAGVNEFNATNGLAVGWYP